MKWEYLRVLYDRGELPPADKLNAFGDDGWELVALVPGLNSSAKTTTYFKREKQDANTDTE